MANCYNTKKNETPRVANCYMKLLRKHLASISETYNRSCQCHFSPARAWHLWRTRCHTVAEIPNFLLASTLLGIPFWAANFLFKANRIKTIQLSHQFQTIRVTLTPETTPVKQFSKLTNQMWNSIKMQWNQLMPRCSNRNIFRAICLAVEPFPAFTAPPLAPKRVRICLIAVFVIGFDPFLGSRQSRDNDLFSNMFFWFTTTCNQWKNALLVQTIRCQKDAQEMHKSTQDAPRRCQNLVFKETISRN